MVRPRADPALGVAEALIKYSEADVRGGPATAATGQKETFSTSKNGDPKVAINDTARIDMGCLWTDRPDTFNQSGAAKTEHFSGTSLWFIHRENDYPSHGHLSTSARKIASMGASEPYWGLART